MKKPTANDLQLAYAAGFISRMEGGEPNPHEPGSELWRNWQDGFEDYVGEEPETK